MTLSQVWDMSVQAGTTGHPIVGKVLDSCNLHTHWVYNDVDTFPPGQYDFFCGLWYYTEIYLNKRWTQGLLIMVVFFPFILANIMYVMINFGGYATKALFYSSTPDWNLYNEKNSG